MSAPHHRPIIWDIIVTGLPGIYGNINELCPQENALGLSSFTAINPWRRAITVTNSFLVGVMLQLINTFPLCTSVNFPMCALTSVKSFPKIKK